MDNVLIRVICIIMHLTAFELTVSKPYQPSGNCSVDTAVACTDNGKHNIILDCTEDCGVIAIVWHEDVTFYGEKRFSFGECAMRGGSCTVPVHGNNMEARLDEFCSKQVRCVVEFEQTWVSNECGDSPLNYIEVTYMCVIPDDLYLAVACELTPQLVMDCERFQQVVALVDNDDFSYFGRQDGDEDVCVIEKGGCRIPLSSSASHCADLKACEGEEVCVVPYVQQADGNCEGGITNFEQVVYECVDPAYTISIACWSAGLVSLEMECGIQSIKLLLRDDLSFYGNVDDVSICDHVNNGCHGAIISDPDHYQNLMSECDGRTSCSVQMVQVMIPCQAVLEYSNYEQVSYACVDAAVSVSSQSIPHTQDVISSTHNTDHSHITTLSVISTGTAQEDDGGGSGWVILLLVIVATVVIIIAVLCIRRVNQSKAKKDKLDHLEKSTASTNIDDGGVASCVYEHGEDHVNDVENNGIIVNSPTVQSDIYVNIGPDLQDTAAPEPLYEDAQDVKQVTEQCTDTVIQNDREFESAKRNVTVPLESMYAPAPTIPSKDIIGENYMETVIQNRKMVDTNGNDDAVVLKNTQFDHGYYNIPVRPESGDRRKKTLDYENVNVDAITDAGEITLAENELYG